MATLTNKQKKAEGQQIELNDDDLDQAAGGVGPGLRPKGSQSQTMDEDLTRPKQGLI